MTSQFPFFDATKPTSTEKAQALDEAHTQRKLQHKNKFKEQQPNTYLNFKEFSKKCSEKWRSISKHEKAKYEALAKLDKARYQEEMVNYVGKRRRRRKKDPQAPRKPPSSFLLFSLDNYTKLKQENPNWTVVQVAKAAGKMWSTTAEEDRKPYEQKAALMRAKYLEEREAYHNERLGRKKNSGSVKTSSKQ